MWNINAGSLIPKGNFGLSFDVKPTMFFDKRAVIDALTKSERIGLSRGSLLVRRTAAKSIKKVGRARAQLKVVSMNSGLALAAIAKLPRRAERFGARTRAGEITKSQRRKVLERMKEIKDRDGSPAGSPPHTHVHSGNKYGFRTNIYNAYDSSTASAVAGPKARGAFNLPKLHEFGGSMKLEAYMLARTIGKSPVIKWFSTTTKMYGNVWIPLGQRKTVRMPPRPFMRPALEKCQPRLAEMFRDTFKK